MLNQWLGTTNFKHKIVIAGNHDIYLAENPNIGDVILSNATYLFDELVTVEGLRIFGSPWVPEFQCRYPMRFMLPAGSESMKKARARIPDNVDILVTHCPPYGYLDKEGDGRDFDRLGCKELAQRVLQVKPKLHVFGHVHGGYGMHKAGGRIRVNAAMCNRAFPPRLTNRPIVVEI